MTQKKILKRRLFLILLILTLILVLGCASIREKQTREITEQIIGRSQGITEEVTPEYKCELKPEPREFNFNKYYTGPLIDTHLHLPVASEIVSRTAMQMGFEDMPHRGQISTDYIVCLSDSEGITKSFGFLIQHKALLGLSVNAVKQDAAKHGEKIIPFFMPPFPIQGQAPEAAVVDEILEDNPDLFQGYGEARFDFQNIANVLPNDDYFQKMYQLADKHNLIVQIHPQAGQVAVLEELFQRYPNVIFLVHLLKDDRAQIGILLEKYPHMYYSLDAEISYIFGHQTIQNNKGPTKEEYLSSSRRNFNTQLQEALRDWKPIIEAHPDQFTWGSDRWFTWHFDREVSDLIVEFGRTFIGNLDPAVQEKFAYLNAEAMLKKR